jgi:arylsulfatase A-like enzyme
LNGPSGTGLDDLYAPEINNSSMNITGSISATEAYDDLKVQAILNEIDGKDSSGTTEAPVPVIFGMNFQAVSVGQKLPVGGYLDAEGTPTANLAGALAHTDASLGRMVAELRKQGLYDTTLIIVTAKHGQSPIDHSLLRTLSAANSGPLGPITTRPSKILANDAAQVTEDDIALVWLTSSSTTSFDVGLLQANDTAAAIQTIFSGAAIDSLFGDPTTDSRVPDIVVQPNPGVIYTKSTGKIAEHGGFAEDDTHVGLLLSIPGLLPGNVDSKVETRQVAPTILNVLGLDPQLLQAVQIEQTPVLPGIQF